MNAQSVSTVQTTIIGRGSKAKPREGWKEEVRDVSATTISIVRSDLRLSEVVQDLIRKAGAWADEHQGSKQVPKATEHTLRIVLESAVRHLKAQFFDHQHLINGTESFPWDQELKQVIEALLGVFRERFFHIGEPLPWKKPSPSAGKRPRKPSGWLARSLPALVEVTCVCFT